MRLTPPHYVMSMGCRIISVGKPPITLTALPVLTGRTTIVGERAVGRVPRVQVGAQVQPQGRVGRVVLRVVRLAVQEPVPVVREGVLVVVQQAVAVRVPAVARRAAHRVLGVLGVPARRDKRGPFPHATFLHIWGLMWYHSKTFVTGWSWLRSTSRPMTPTNTLQHAER